MKRCLAIIAGLLQITVHAAPPSSGAPSLTATTTASQRPAVWTEPLTGMTFVRVEKSCFHMGSKSPFAMSGQTLAEAGYKGDPAEDEHPEHQACLSEFWIGQYEVRADEWERLMKVPPPVGRGHEPASGISWRDAVHFSEQLTKAGDGQSEFGLPTEAQWEIACLAGASELVTSDTNGAALHSTTVFSGSNRKRPLNPRPQPVGSRQPNAWGIFDMRGNVSEWVLDSYDKDGYKRHTLYDPVIRNSSGQRVLRGGSFRSEIVHLRCASRSWYLEEQALPAFGMRLTRKVKP